VGKPLKEFFMKKSILFLGIPALTLVLGLVFAGCSNSTGGDQTGGSGDLSAELKESDRIKVSTSVSLVESLSPGTSSSGANGFSVTVGGVSQSISSISTFFGDNYSFNILLTAGVPGTGDIRVSYNGTGVFAGKLGTFTNLAVSR
jgi:hypothetical protein